MKTLKERLANWTDFDIAEYELGVVIGIFPEFGDGEYFRDNKWIFWSANELGDNLCLSLMKLVDAGILEKNDGGFKFSNAYIIKELIT